MTGDRDYYKLIYSIIIFDILILDDVPSADFYYRESINRIVVRSRKKTKRKVFSNYDLKVLLDTQIVVREYRIEYVAIVFNPHSSHQLFFSCSGLETTVVGGHYSRFMLQF